MNSASDSARNSRATIAVVEDDVSVNQAVRRLLEAAGFTTCTFGSGQAALATNAAFPVDCMVLDIHLPDMSGFELHRRLTGTQASIPVVVITAHDDPDNRRAAQEIGAVAYLTKPFSSRSLLDAVARALALEKP